MMLALTPSLLLTAKYCCMKRYAASFQTSASISDSAPTSAPTIISMPQFCLRVRDIKMQKLIGLAGFSGAGKNYTANLICHLRPEFQQIAFADPLKAAMSSVFGFSAEQLHSLERSTVDHYWGATPRELMQLVGTDLFRNQYRQDVWIKSIARRVQQYDHVVITDVRFRNEVDWIRQTGGEVWLVDDGEYHNCSLHPSETLPLSRELFDVILDNRIDEYNRLHYQLSELLNKQS